MNKILSNLNAAGAELFYTDGSSLHTWDEAKSVVASITQLFRFLEIKSGDVVAIDNIKDFHTYSAIMACYVNGITFAPVNFDELEESKCIPNILKPILFLSSQCKNIKSNYNFKIIGDVCIEFPEKSQTEYISSPAGLDVAYIMQSSGSTGTPKVIPISFDNLHNYLDAAEELNYFESQTRFAQVVSLTFDLSIHDIFLSFRNMGSLVPLMSSIAKLAPRFINSFGINHIMAVPSFYQQMVALKEEMQSVRSVFVCGEALRKEVARHLVNIFPNARIFNFYGPTETTVAISYYELNRNMEFEKYDIVPIGTALPGNYLELSNDGELLLGGNQVFQGYYNKSSLDRFVFHNGNRYYASGDFCKYEDASFQFLGRIDFQIKFRGYRLELEGLEAMLGNTFGCDFAAIGYEEYAPSNYMGLAVFFTKESLLSRQILSILPSHLAGAVAVQIREIPRNSSGKIDRKKLVEFL